MTIPQRASKAGTSLSTVNEERERAVVMLQSEGIVKSKAVAHALLTVPRQEFLPSEVKKYAYVDTPIPIGYGQTTSAIHMTAMFCEYSTMALGQKILEVGGGCGYMSCVYAEIVAPSDMQRDRWGHVWSVELVKELAELAKQNIERTGYSDRVTMIHGDASEGLPEHAPYDVIIVTSAAPDVPKPMIDQLAPEGVLLIPVGGPHLYQELIRVKRSKNGRTEEESLGGVAFVPMRGKSGWKG